MRNIVKDLWNPDKLSNYSLNTTIGSNPSLVIILPLKLFVCNLAT